MIAEITLSTMEDVKKLSDAVCKQGSEVYLHSKDNTVMIDARSLLSLFALMGKPCLLVGEDSMDPKVFAKLSKDFQ